MANYETRWVYIFGMENEDDVFGSLLANSPFGDFASPGLYKIGTTTNPVRRWQQVQVHSPWDLRVFAILRGGFKLEALIHKSLEEYRTRGEWFAMSRQTMHRVLEELEDSSSIGRKMFGDLPWCSIVCIGEET